MKRWTLVLIFLSVFWSSSAIAKAGLGEQVADAPMGEQVADAPQTPGEQVADVQLCKEQAQAVSSDGKKIAIKKRLPEKKTTEKEEILKEKKDSGKTAAKQAIETEKTERQNGSAREDVVNVREKDLTIIIVGLAEQVGVPAEQLFPWYIRQQRIEAWSKILSGLILFFIGIGIASNYYNRINWQILNGWVVLSGTGAIIAFAAALFFAFNIGEAINKLINPQYYALRALIEDVSKLI